MSKSLPIPAPTAKITGCNLSLLYILSALDFSTLSIFPQRGRIAWNPRSRPCFAVPPAESPSTRKISHIEASLLEQSASFPGKPSDSKAPFRMIASLAARAALRI